MAYLDTQAKQNLIQFSLDQGFDVARITSADIGSLTGERLEAFISEGRHGEMDWLENRKAWRKNPVSLWPEAKSALVLGLNYGPEVNPNHMLGETDYGVISVYARGKDYHDVIKKRLKRIAREIVATLEEDVKVFVDTAPVMEKPLAAASGVGWQGKHTNLLSREFGSWLFLGVILTTAEIEPDDVTKGDCGSCTACLDVCPTDAFVAPYQLDARKCISYLTIETRSHIPRDMRPKIGNRIYGCDDCLAVCPWNKYAKQSSEITFKSKDSLDAPKLADLVVLDDPEFRELFRGSAVKRLGRNRFIRNVIVAIGNSGNDAYVQAVIPLLEDESPIVRLAAVWALRQLATGDCFLELFQRHSAHETDDAVKEEWRLCRKELDNE